MTEAVRVAIVDDQNLVRAGIRGLLELSPEVAVIGEAANGDEALELLVAEPPDVLLLDLRMPVRDGIGTLREMAARRIAVPALVLTTFDDVDLVLDAVRSGARGYLLKDVTLDELVDGIRQVASGRTALQPTLTARLATPEGYRVSPGRIVDDLTERESDVLRLLAGGYSNREIAELLHLAEGTVKNHVSNVLVKLGARDRTHAVVRALQHGLLASS